MTSATRTTIVYAGLGALAVALYLTVGAQKPPRTKADMIALGTQHKTAADLFQALKDEAKGGHRSASAHRPLQQTPTCPALFNSV